MRLTPFALAMLLGSGIASADDIDRKLTSYESEARQLGANLPQPNTLPGTPEHRLVDAQVAFALGDYDTSALMLFDLAKQPSASQGADNQTATFYLGESLYQKGDKGAARSYFQQIAKAGSGKYYQQSLERLVEIAIAQNDTSAEAQEAVTTLGQLSAGVREPAVPYVLGKYAFAQGKYDDALALLNEVPKGSDYELQAEYYSGTVAVAKKDLARATEIFTDLIGRKPRTANDRRVIELGALALGRLYYEREQPGKSIDAYLLVDRRSDLFPDALYEVAWVYVKGKQYDKALRALELLETSDPNTTKTPTTRILEGNLRIRKAQMIRAAQVNGTINPNDNGDPAVEYDKAAKLFTDTHDQYMPSYVALQQMVDGNLDPASFIEQIAGRQQHVFQIVAPLPEAAAQWLRDDPRVQRFVGVETDLADVESNIDQSKSMIERLEGVLAAPDHSGVYPEIASRRARIASIENDLVSIRNELADEQLALVSSSADLAQMTANRKQLAQQYAEYGNPEQAASERLTSAQQGFDKIDADAGEVDGMIDSAQAISVALRKYANDANPALPADQKASLQTNLDAAAKEAQAIEDELDAVHKEVLLGKDLAGVGDAKVTEARDLRRKLSAAQDGEQHALDGFVSASRDQGKSKKLAGEADRAWRLAANLDQLETTLAQAVEQGLSQVKIALAQERQNLVDYAKELAEYETESRDIGKTVLGASFKDVKAKFYDVIVRTDVGNVDVAWSQKEDNDDDLKRLNLARARELKQLKDEFHDILEEQAPKPSAPKKTSDSEMPAPGPESGGGPDTGKGGTDRVAPVDDQKAGSNTQPTVKPDEQKGAQPKKGGSK
jgi:tetratricopeptide (TPR) repeat protein